jgi:peptidoglycan/LPS O-acetylase OafA/YrhL
LFLLFQIILGHIAGISLPQFSNLQFPQDWFEIIFKLLTRFGAQSAYLFIFLSGFMVGGKIYLTTEKGNKIGVKFLKSKIKRLFPVAIIAIIFTASLDLLAIKYFGLIDIYKTSFNYDVNASLTISNLIGNIFFLQPVFFDSFGSNGPLWTVGYIMQYYIITWILVNILSKSKIIGVLIIIPIIIFMITIKLEWFVMYILWLFGGFCYIYKFPCTFKNIYIPISVLLFILANILNQIMSWLIIFLVGLYLVSGISCIKNEQNNSYKFLRKFTEKTYSLYLFHYPILVFIYAVIFNANIKSTIEFIEFTVISLLTLSFLMVNNFNYVVAYIRNLRL